MKRILAAVDFTSVTDEVVTTAIDLTRRLDGTLRLMHADLLEVFFCHYGLEHVESFDAQLCLEGLDRRQEESAMALEDLRRRVEKEGVEASTLLLVGDTVEEILTAARDFRADLIVMGSHRHSRLHRALFGDTTTEVLTHSPCPVLVVPPDRDEA